MDLKNLDVRNDIIEHANVDIINKVGSLPFLPNSLFVSMQGCADFFGVKYEAIRHHLRENKNEFENDKSYVLSGEDLKEFKRNYAIPDNIITPKTRSFYLITRKSILRLAMFLKKSPVAQQIRHYLLVTEENTSIKDKQKYIQMSLLNDSNKEKSNTATNNLITIPIKKVNNAIKRLEVYGYDKIDSAALIQEAIVSGNNIEEEILRALHEKQDLKEKKIKGLLLNRIKYIATEYFDCNYSKVYEKISIYIKYNVGIDIFSIKHQKFNKTKSYLDLFIEYDVVKDVFDYIDSLNLQQDEAN